MNRTYTKNQGKLVYVTEKSELKVSDFAYCTETREVIQISEILTVDHLYKDMDGNVHYDNFDPWSWRKILITNDHDVYEKSNHIQWLSKEAIGN